MAKYLDYSGVQTLWSKIKVDAITKVNNIISNGSNVGIHTPSQDDCSAEDRSYILSFKKYKMNSNGTFVDSGINTELTIPSATSTSSGVMSKADKIKLDSISQTDITNLKAITTKLNEGYTLILTK